MTQAFFARLIEKGTVAAANPVRGRFRAFLLTDCRFFLADARDRGQALKRGGGVVSIAFDARDAENRYHLELSHMETPERLFDRAWALSLLDRAMDTVARHYADSGRVELFERLRPSLASTPRAESHEEIGRGLGMSAGAVQVALHRMRARYGRTLRDLVASTLDSDEASEIDDEIRDLFAALAG